MQTKPLLYGIIGFLIGGLVVSIAATTFENPESENMHSIASSLHDKTGDEFDKAFISGMVAHHQDAINMANMAKDQAKHQEIKDLSKAIIKAQQREINEMKQWQKDMDF